MYICMKRVKYIFKCQYMQQVHEQPNVKNWKPANSILWYEAIIEQCGLLFRDYWVVVYVFLSKCSNFMQLLHVCTYSHTEITVRRKITFQVVIVMSACCCFYNWTWFLCIARLKVLVHLGVYHYTPLICFSIHLCANIACAFSDHLLNVGRSGSSFTIIFSNFCIFLYIDCFISVYFLSVPVNRYLFDYH